MTDLAIQGMELAIKAFSEGRLDDAKDMIESSPSIYGNSAKAQNLLGSVYARQGDSAKSKEIWEAALMIEPRIPMNFANTWSNLAGAYMYDGDLEEAEKAATRALDTIPDHLGAMHNRALVRQAQGKFADALTDFDFVVANRPEMADAWLAKSICELRLNDAKAARVSVEKSLERNPLNPSSHAHLGAIYEVLGDNLMAHDSFRRASELAPGNEGLQRAMDRTA